MVTHLIDTEILSFFLRQREPVNSKIIEFLKNDGRLAISVITYYEISRGLKFLNATRQLKIFETFADTNLVLPVDQDVCDRAATIHAELRKKGNLIEDADLLIASTALAHDFPLVTNNVAHYSRIPNLQIENWNE